jgi:hypothetical protein
MAKAPSAALKRALASSSDRTAPPEDKLEEIREDMRRARDLELRAKELAEELGAVQGELQTLLTARIPEKFEALGIDKLGLLPEGNLPGYDAQLKPFYRAAIPAGWPVDKQEKAFEYLDKNDAGDLIKATFAVELPRGSEKQQAVLRKALEKTGLPFTERKAVNHNTLTAWVKEQIEKHATMPDLETLGARVGKIINLKPRKES